MNNTCLKLVLLSLLFFNFFSANSQITAPLPTSLELPRISPKAVISQRIGITDISIEYSRPSLKGRKLLGSNIIPYDRVWRAGANECTNISFSHDIEIEGKPLKSGNYGLFMIPHQNNEWTIIFSKHNNGWGSFTYDKSEDALRVKVESSENKNSVEGLKYEFTNIERDQVELALLWGEVKVSFAIHIEVDMIVLQQIRRDLKSTAGTGGNWVSWNQAASYIIENNIKENFQEAKKWLEQSIARDGNFVNLMNLSKLEGLLGNVDVSNEFKEKAFNKATPRELRGYSFRLMGRPKFDKNREEAFRILQLGLKNNPDNMLSYGSLADWYATKAVLTKKEKATAIQYYKKAKELAGGKFPILERSWNQNIEDLESKD